jgi:GT2 family glycosyltransferase
LLRDAELIANPVNGGFSAGCNVGIRRALDLGADSVLLVNSDIVLAPDAIPLLLRAFDADRRVGIAAPLTVSREEPDRVASAGISYVQGTGRMRHILSGADARSVRRGTIADVTAVSGCAMLVRREVFERAGLFDEEYFFSFEDLDLCLRAAAVGFKTVCTYDARAYHEGGRTIGPRSQRRVYFATRNHLKLAARTPPRSVAVRAVRACGIVGLNVAYVLTSADAPLVAGLAAVARGTWHHVIGRYGID